MLIPFNIYLVFVPVSCCVVVVVLWSVEAKDSLWNTFNDLGVTVTDFTKSDIEYGWSFYMSESLFFIRHGGHRYIRRLD